ncbi:MAG TPA: hypothetical protein VFB21_20500 [Chthonomonadaceae bacterium]|nr:hypothetical protein [Chthonomonadaceae bacterium]
MNKLTASSFLSSPLLLAAMLVSFASTAIFYYELRRPPLAPTIPGYELAGKSNVLVVGYASGCSCSLAMPTILEEALRKKMAVLVLGDSERADLVILRSTYEKRGVVVLLGMKRNIMQTFCPRGTMTYSIVQHGYILRQKQAAASLRDVMH